MRNDYNEIIQGRLVTGETIRQINEQITSNPSWNRTRLSRELCQQWNWKNARGALKDMACRTLLLKLENKERIKLPKRQRIVRNENRNKKVKHLLHSKQPIETSLKQIRPLQITVVKPKDPHHKLYNFMLHQYHYLSFRGIVGENIKYLIRDKNDNVISCLLFGAAAWRTADRDNFIGWRENKRKANLHLICNNSRFLIFDWVKVPNLASFILGKISKRISTDFQNKYGHEILLLETFVEKERFTGSCYKAANWIHVGQTQGRSRNDRYKKLVVPVKKIFLYPLTKHFKERLNG
jgi:hypothetical protein